LSANENITLPSSMCPSGAKRGPSRRYISPDRSNDRTVETIALMSTHNVDSFWYISTIRRTRDQAIMVPPGSGHPPRLVAVSLASLRPSARLTPPERGSERGGYFVLTGVAVHGDEAGARDRWKVREDGVIHRVVYIVRHVVPLLLLATSGVLLLHAYSSRALWPFLI